MNIEQFYEENEDFKNYMKAYAKSRGLTHEEAMSHKYAYYVAEYYAAKEKDVIAEPRDTFCDRR